MLVSTYRRTSSVVKFPTFSSTRIMMMPVRIGDWAGVPELYRSVYGTLCDAADGGHRGHVGYLTIDEQELAPGETLRRPGLHVDGYLNGRSGSWGGGGGGWGSVGNGMLTVSNTAHCRAYAGVFEEEPGPDGECDHVAVGHGHRFEPRQVYWVDGACVHESLPVSVTTRRQFVRLSLPSLAPWFEGYTENLCGVQPSGETWPRRHYL